MGLTVRTFRPKAENRICYFCCGFLTETYDLSDVLKQNIVSKPIYRFYCSKVDDKIERCKKDNNGINMPIKEFCPNV